MFLKLYTTVELCVINESYCICHFFLLSWTITLYCNNKADFRHRVSVSATYKNIKSTDIQNIRGILILLSYSYLLWLICFSLSLCLHCDCYKSLTVILVFTWIQSVYDRKTWNVSNILYIHFRTC